MNMDLSNRCVSYDEDSPPWDHEFGITPSIGSGNSENSRWNILLNTYNRFGFLFCHIVLTFQFLELLPFEFPKFPKSPPLTTHTQAYELISQFILVNGRWKVQISFHVHLFQCFRSLFSSHVNDFRIRNSVRNTMCYT